jgi:molybdopterin converting factor small subunit
MNPAGSRAPTQGAAPPERAGAPANAVLLLFAAARAAAGTRAEQVRAHTVGEALDGARVRYGEGFAAILESCRVWVNGEPAQPDQSLHDGDEIAVLPPVSGGAP